MGKKPTGSNEKALRKLTFRLFGNKLQKIKKDADNDEKLRKEKGTGRQSGELKEAIAADRKRSRGQRRHLGNKRKTETKVPQTPETKQPHFVMSSGDCLLNGEPFDPNNLPDGVVVVVDQKRATSEREILNKQS